MTRIREEGIALIVVLLAMLLMSAIGIVLVLATVAETHIAGNFRNAQQTLYAADAAAERAIDDLCAVPDWNTLLAGGTLSAFVDGPPTGKRWLDDGSFVDLAQAVNIANCQKSAACTVNDMNANSDDRLWGANNPRWTLFAYGRLNDMLPAGPAASPHYVIVMAADDPAETDNDPATDAAPGNPGAGILALRAEAFGPGGAHKVIELTVARSDTPCPNANQQAASGMARLVTWRELR